MQRELTDPIAFGALAASVLARMASDLDLIAIGQQVRAMAPHVKLVDVQARWAQIQERAQQLDVGG